MKKIYILGLLLTVASFGCKKVLDVVPFSAIPFDEAFSSADYCLLSLNGVYDAAQSGPWSPGASTERRGYPFGAASIEQGDARGEDVINLAAFFQVTYQASYNATTANNVGHWDNLYSLINKANVSIDGFKGAAEKSIISAELASQYEAECRFLRALAHHELVVHYARPFADGAGNKLGVPYRDFAIASSDAVNEIRKTPRPTVAENYAKILADTRSSATLKTTRATKAAAIALKMRVKLHKGDWDGVIAEGNKLVPASVNPLDWASVTSPIGGWALTTAVDGPFTNNSSTESVFSIKNDAQDAPSVNGGLAGMLGSASLGGRGLVAISPIIWNNTGWKCDDKRRTALYVTGASNISTTNLSYFTTKYKDYTTRGDFAPMIRYAEVLLTLAEAEARKAGGVSDRAVALLNVVRNRGLQDPATEQYKVADFADNVALTKAILLERRIEFLAEGKRWPDIHRNALDPNYTTGGIPAKAVNGANGLAIYGCGVAYTPGQEAIPYDDFRFIWPIPANEIIQNPIIEQNPLY
jgi:hypothetical protein